MYQIITPNIFTTTTFRLVRNRMEVGRFTLLLIVCICVIPTIFGYVIYDVVLDLGKTDLIIATVITGLILLNCTLFLLSKLTKKNRTLIIGYNDLRILENLRIIQIIPFEKVSVTKFQAENDRTNSQNFIRINTIDFPDMIIGEPLKSSLWETSKNKINTSINHTVYFTKTNEEWFRLEEALKHFL